MSRRHSVTRSRTSLSTRSSTRTSSAEASNSSARATSGLRSKPNAVSIAPPCPLRAKRLPFGLSRRITSPQSTSAARCRRSVAGAMPWARSASCWLEGNTIRFSPLSVVSGWKVNRASRTAKARSETPILALAVQIARNTCHLCTAFSDDRAFAFAWLATWASVSDRRPKGVVELWGCISMPSIGQKTSARRNDVQSLMRLLTVIRGSVILLLPHREKGFRNSVSGAFFF